MSAGRTTVGPVFWMTAFLDFSPAHHEEGVAFWSALTSYDVSPVRGDAGEFATLQPPDGDGYLRAQRLGDGPDRVHLDLHVPDPRAAADDALVLGASEIADQAEWGYVVLRSPGGFVFCFVSHDAGTVPAPTTWPGGHSSRADQVCLDIPHDSYDTETAFWAGVTGWERRRSSVSDEFTSLLRPAGQPVRILLQRLGADDGGTATRAHLDWAATDRAAETERHVALGATVEVVQPQWTVLVDPVGRRYCITDRNPETGVPGPIRLG